jgi:Mn-dependent DtxR family transcriptional regulator
MTYERTQAIEQRLEQAIALIRSQRLNATQLAKALDVSGPTVQRVVAELRRRGHSIQAVRDDQGWRYELASKGRAKRGDRP